MRRCYSSRTVNHHVRRNPHRSIYRRNTPKASDRSLITNSVTKIIDVTPERAGLAAAAYALFGKGFHKASLNFGDCFAYATAKEFNCPLLYIGEDFARTDVVSAIASPSA